MKLPSIAIYCSSGSWGGLEMNTERLAHWMIERHHQVTLFCLENSPLANHASKENVPLRFISRNKRYFDLPGAIVVKRELDRLNIRIVILVDNRDLDFGGLVKLLYCNKIRLVYQQHMRLGTQKKDPIHTFRFRQLDAWITLLPYMKEEILSRTSFPKERIHLIPLGLEVNTLQSSLPSKQMARQQLGLPPHDLILGILGRLDPQKGQHLVIEALTILKAQGVNCQLLIMGETTRGEGDHYLQYLQDLVDENEMQNEVFFRGYQDDIAVFYAAIDLFVLGSFEETYGMVTIEAMLSGLPVVGSRAGGTTELLSNGTFGWLYRAKDSVDLAVTINMAISNPEKLKQVSTHAKEHATTNYSHTEECTKIEQLLKNLNDLD